MTQASIAINGVSGSNVDLPIATLVTLNNVGNGGESTFLWTILDQPSGTADALSSTTVQSPTFTPNKEGDYLIQVIVNQSLADEQRQRVVCGVKTLKTRQNIPAAGETTETGTRGTAVAVNSILRLVDNMRADPGILVVQLGATLAANTVCRFTDTAVIKSGLPGQETLPVVTQALATQSYITTEELALVIAAVDGGALTSGKLAYVKVFGPVYGLTIASAVDEDPIYVSDTGTLSRTVGTNTRRVGKLMRVSAGVSDLFFKGLTP